MTDNIYVRATAHQLQALIFLVDHEIFRLQEAAAGNPQPDQIEVDYEAALETMKEIAVNLTIAKG